MSEKDKTLEVPPDDGVDETPDEDLATVPAALSAISERVLVWKNEDGVHGFGNIQYPQEESITIPVHGRWRYLNWPSTDKEKAEAPKTGPGKEKAETPKTGPGKEKAETPKTGPGKEKAETPKTGPGKGKAKTPKTGPEKKKSGERGSQKSEKPPRRTVEG
ncbi:MAG: hypothetical protein GY859_13020 [Desulfobacterales bacterium]|nr:hypothetical protein [Desulfobacterales bacterium]